MRAFSTLELLIAMTIATTSITAGVLITFGTPMLLENARLERNAYDIASAMLNDAELSIHADASIVSIGTTSSGTYTQSLFTEYLDERLVIRLTSFVEWLDVYKQKRFVRLQSLVTNPDAALDELCSPIVVGDWSTPHELNVYHLTSSDLLSGMTGRYPIADIALTRQSLVVAVASTSISSDPTLLLFSLSNHKQRPQLQGKFDNATSSRIGFSSVTTGAGYVYATSAFGSNSPSTCASGACAQLHVFDPVDELRLVGSATLATSSPPFALSVNNISTGGKSIVYRDGYVYLGLEKTISGYEFNILDVRNPESPRWVSGIPIGRSVNDIHIRNGFAFLGTSDSSRELIVVDIRDPRNPHIVSTWNAPGSVNFGLGKVVASQRLQLYFGRSYVGNASEFYTIDISNPVEPTLVNEKDLGILKRPESVQGVIARDFLLAVLSGNNLKLWDTTDNEFRDYAPTIKLPGTGTSLACRGNVLYIGLIDESGNGLISVISSS